MGIRCPACGFESAPEAQWCDFCKEPFRPKKRAQEPEEVKHDPTAPLLDVESVWKALAKDKWPQLPHMSPMVRTAVFVLAGFFGFYAIAMSVLWVWNARSYSGPGSDIELGKPVVIDLKK